ncbi:hypothetical protein HO133_005158 [Letharia lupina]|uniref:Kinetochore protein mis14 n=1 Tax=Letharia lupina TaxID=560253 RepID=A0A8H6F960_9LECA|nr:uncharacterized protein HO133_005158 [Letharia lupina]KAF6219333.1 hypothetical protein HO133_005158 [Letharia lupina]
MDAHHRKIDLQSPSDLTYLFNNIKAAARQKMDLAIPPSAAPEGEDAYRSKVEELVQEYIVQTLTRALPSLTLNGLDPSPTLLRPNAAPEANTPDDNSNYEPYDPRLAERLRTLYAEFDTQSTRIAELRRDAPGAAARGYVERLEAELKREKEMEKEREWQGLHMEAEYLDLGIVKRKDDMERMWGRGTERLVELGKIPGVLAKLERAEKAVEVVKEGSCNV